MGPLPYFPFLGRRILRLEAPRHLALLEGRSIGCMGNGVAGERRGVRNLGLNFWANVCLSFLLC